MVRESLCLSLVAMLAGCISVHETKHVVEEPPAAAEYVQTGVQGPVQVLRHVVLFQWKEDTSAADIRRIENAFCALPSRIDGIYDFEWGTDVSVEDLQKGFTHCFVVSFLSEADRASYLPHPAHQEFVELMKPHMADVLVIDYWAN